MIITAKFTGQDDNSLGLKQGETYKLSWVYNGFIMVDNKLKEHKYDSVGSFLKNWTEIQVISN